MTLTYISCSSDFYTFYVNVPLSLGCMIRKVSAEDIAIRGNGTGLEYMCPTRHFVYIFFNPVFQVSTAKNEINLFNNHIMIEAPVTFVPAGAMTPSAEFLLYILCFRHTFLVLLYIIIIPPPAHYFTLVLYYIMIIIHFMLPPHVSGIIIYYYYIPTCTLFYIIITRGPAMVILSLKENKK